MSQFLVGLVDNSTIVVMDAETGLETIKFSEDQGVQKIAINVDGSLIVGGNNKGHLNVWSVTSGTSIFNAKLPSANLQSISLVNFNLDGSQVITITENGIFTIWDIASGETINRWGGHFSSGQRFARFTTSGDKIISVTKFFEYAVWDIAKGTQTVHIGPPRGTKACTIPAGNSPLIAYCDREGSMIVRNLTSNAEIFTVKGRSINVVKFDSVGERLLSMARNEAKVWDALTGAEICSFQGHNDAAKIIRACFNANGSRAATVDSNFVLHVWDADLGLPIYTLQFPGIVALSFGGESLEFLLK